MSLMSGLFAWTYHYDVPIVNLNVDYLNDTHIYTETQIGPISSLSMEENGQGRYFVVESGRFGRALIKYLGNDSYVTDQIKAFREMEFEESAINSIRDADHHKNYEREIQFVNKLNHPNIARTLAFLSTDGTAEGINALVIEYAAQGTLQSYVKRIGTQFTDERIRKFAFQLADALEYCHDKNIIHRDVTPVNVYVHSDGEDIKLGNFGYAREENNLHKTANKGDDVVYKAPEIIKNQALASYGKSVDVYSFGMVVWYMAHRGEEPFEKEFRRPIKSHTKVKKHLEDGHRPEIRGDLEDLIVQIITSCWINESQVDHRPIMKNICLTLKKSC